MRRIDLTNKSFGKLTALSYAGREQLASGGEGAAMWLCRCVCGGEITARSSHLRGGFVKRCGACRRVDLLGQQFGRLRVIASAGQPKNRVATKARWLCRCECGKEIITRTDSLRIGRSTSCGCWLSGSRLPNKGAAWNQVLSKQRAQAHARGLDWALSAEEAFALVRLNCHYCGSAPSQPRHSNNDKVLFTGIDRVDSSRGYLPENVVPCCKSCNFAKNTMGYEEFRVWVGRIYAHWAAKSEPPAFIVEVEAA